MKTRQELNREIIKIISDLNEREPDLRFNQILRALESNLEFYEESEITLDRMKKQKKEIWKLLK